ncbi:hypothetical protein [Carnobacterium mobile]|uniref:hypothetical protein n=1 Tax=Carnobacterium mobile TaxID=2750 RepID=UPI00054D8A3C|nr:hypothetical protein [Carnobacterium mobile]
MKYQKIKKEIIDAIQIQKEILNEVLSFVGEDHLMVGEVEEFAERVEIKGLYVQTMKGTERASFGDYIIRTDEGYIVMNGTYFETLYEKVAE